MAHILNCSPVRRSRDGTVGAIRLPCSIRALSLHVANAPGLLMPRHCISSSYRLDPESRGEGKQHVAARCAPLHWHFGPAAGKPSIEIIKLTMSDLGKILKEIDGLTRGLPDHLKQVNEAPPGPPTAPVQPARSQPPASPPPAPQPERRRTSLLC